MTRRLLCIARYRDRRVAGFLRRQHLLRMLARGRGNLDPAEHARHFLDALRLAQRGDRADRAARIVR
jgi:hypothetical protein